jgi:hypothetical protein
MAVLFNQPQIKVQLWSRSPARYEMVKRLKIMPWMEVKTARTAIVGRMRAAADAAKIATFVYDNYETDAPQECGADCDVLRVCEVELADEGGDVLDANAAVYWGDFSWCRFPVSCLLTTPQGCRDVARCVSCSREVFLMSAFACRAFARAAVSLEVGADFALCLSLEESGMCSILKAIVNRMGSNPRSVGRHTGVLSTSMDMAEAVWKVAFHDKAPASCCVWSQEGMHATEKPAWRQPPHQTPSRLKYRFDTVVGWHKVADMHKLCVPLVRDVGMVMCPLPKGHINRRVLPAELSVVEGAVIHRSMMHVPQKALSYASNGLQFGEDGIILGKR